MNSARYRVCFPFVGDTIGGSHLSTLPLLNHLPEPYRPLVVVHERGALSDYFDAQGVAYELVPLSRYVGRSRGAHSHFQDVLATVLPISRFIRARGIDIVHPQDGRMNMTWMLPARLTQRRLVWHQRSMFAASRLTSLMMRGAHQILCVSKFVADSMPAHCRTEIMVIDDPHDTSRPPPERSAARAELARELGVGVDIPLVGFFANLTRQKRPDVFVDAAAEVCREVSRAPLFLLFGRDYDGMAAALRQRATEFGIADRVRFMGFRSPAEPLMAACDLIAVPGVNDAFPRVLIEAMQVGTPLVAAHSGGHPDILEHDRTAVLFEPDVAAALGRGVSELLGDRARRESLAREARAAAMARYSVARHVTEITAVYADTMAKASGGDVSR
jgi:glycosyltransferase involved in cell wall biosynthesis